MRSFSMTLLTLALLASVACGGADTVAPGPGPGPGPSAADSVLIQIDDAATYQTIDGFGSATLSLVYPNGDHLGAYRGAAIKAAFGDVGISLGLLTTGLIETPADATDLFGQRANDNGDPQIINPAGFNFTNPDNIWQKIVTPAAPYGYADLTLGPLLNLRVPLSWLQPIRSTDYSRYLDEAAENVLALVQHSRDSYGRTPKLLELFNEPTTGNQELQSASLLETVDLVARIGARLHAAGFADTKFLVPNEETIARSFEVAQAMLSDPGARPYVGVIGYHAYPYGSAYSSPRRILESSGEGTPDVAARQQLEQLKALGRQYGVPVWLTEVSEGPGNNDYGFDAIENVLARAIHIHDNFEYAGASAFLGMNTIWDSQTHEEHFAGRDIPFLSEQSGMVLVDVSTGKISITGMGYAVGHYARWIRGGAIRIGATSEDPRVIATAFRDPVNSRVVLVVVNNEDTEQLLRVRLSGAAAAGNATGESSSGSVRWRTIPPFAAGTGGDFENVAPAKSVVTIAIPID
jgi:O-glycosyl hydrolase